MPITTVDNYDFGGSKRRRSKKRIIKRSRKSVKQLARRVGQLMGEKKYHITNSAYGTLVPLSAGSIVSLTDAPQGDGDQQREGDQLSLTSIELIYNAQMIVGGSSLFGNLRVIVFQYIPNTSADPTVSLVMLTGASAATTQAYMVPYNHDNRYNFRILYDKFHSFSNGSTAIANANSVMQARRKRIIKFKNTNIQYNAAGITGSNKVYLLVMGDQSTTANVSFTYIAKMNFRDH